MANRQLKFNPINGAPYEGIVMEEYFRIRCNYAWFYNPFNGSKRNDMDIKSDPFGRGIVEQDALLHPANKNKYQRLINNDWADIYDVLTAWEVSNPAIQHAIKKLLQPGQRGHKTRAQDLQEALVSIQRAIELEEK